MSVRDEAILFLPRGSSGSGSAIGSGASNAALSTAKHDLDGAVHTNRPGHLFPVGQISPAAITADVDDWAPDDLDTACVVRISADAARALNGIAGGDPRRAVALVNVGAFDITLVHDAATSAAVNRFALANDTDVALSPGTAVLLLYDETSAVWRLMGGGGPGGGGVSLGSATPLVESGSGSAGASGNASREDHVHPADGGDGGGGTNIPPLVQAAVSAFSTGTTALALTALGSAPTSGNRIYCTVHTSGRGASSITQTGVTWTNLYTSNDGSRWTELWVGVVGAGAGTGITVNFASSTRSQAIAWEMTTVLTTVASSVAATSDNVGPLSTSAGDYVFVIATNITAGGGALVVGLPMLPLFATAGQGAAGVLVSPGGPVWCQRYTNTGTNRIALLVVS